MVARLDLAIRPVHIDPVNVIGTSQPEINPPVMAGDITAPSIDRTGERAVANAGANPYTDCFAVVASALKVEDERIALPPVVLLGQALLSHLAHNKTAALLRGERG